MPKIFDRTDEQLGQKTIRINEDVWFEIQQHLLLQIVNTREGRDLLCIPQSYGKIFKIGKNHVFHSPRMEGKEFKYDWDFRIGTKYGNGIRQRWHEFQNMARYFQTPAHMKPVVLVGTRAWAFGGPYYPDPDVETTTVDGRVENEGTVYATVHDAIAGSSAADNSVTQYQARNSFFGGTTYNISRGFYLFDTAAIEDTDTISSATFSICGSGTAEANADTETMVLVASTPATNVALVVADFDQLGTTSFGTFAVAGYDQTDGTYNNITINATGIAAISKTGVTKFGLRMQRDIDSSAPTGENYIHGYQADQALTTKDPKLTGTSSFVSPVSIATTSLLLGVGN